MNTYSLFLNIKMPKEKLASEINPNKRARNDSTILSGNLSKLNDLLNSISSDETSFKQAIALILNKDVFKNAIAGVLVPEVTTLRREIITLKSKVDDMEQYTQVAQNVFITFYLGCKDVMGKRFEKNIFKTFA